MICLELWQYLILIGFVMYPITKLVFWICEISEMIFNEKYGKCCKCSCWTIPRACIICKVKGV